MNFIPLNIKTHFSVRQSLITPKNINIENFAFCDSNIVSGAVQFKNKKPNCSIGTEVFNEHGDSVLLLAKNYKGWLELIKVVSNKSLFDKKKDQIVIDRDYLYTLKNVIVIYLYPENKPLYGSYYGIDLTRSNYDMVRYVAKSKDFPSVCVHSSFYPREQDKDDFITLLALAHNKNIQVIKSEYSSLLEKPLHILSEDDAFKLGYTSEEIYNTSFIFSNIEKFSLKKEPQVPKFETPNGMNSYEYLSYLCHANLNSDPVYKERLDFELAVIKEFGLSDYFLIVADIIKYVTDNFHLTGIRGSGTGSIISYLSGISKVDPIKYDLIFERFINKGRMTEGRVQLPDIDIDVPAEARESIINYIKQKYRPECVGQILTYQRIKTAAAIKTVFRANNALSFEEINEITKNIPEEAKISDKLKETGHTSVLMYMLEYHPDKLDKWVVLDENNVIRGDYNNYFEQVVRLEGLNSARSKHAAGIMVAPYALEELCPMIYDHSSDTWVCAMEMTDLEELGILKLDILGLRLFDKMLDIYRIVNDDKKIQRTLNW